MTTAIDTPISRVLAKLEGVKRSDGGWVARCPAHGDKHQSLGIDVEDGRVLLRCHAGCETDQIVSSMGLRMSDLFPSKPERSERRERGSEGPKSLTLAELCAHKKLPPEFVASLGWHETVQRHGTRVEIPYPKRDGTVHRTRYRFALQAKEGSAWGPGSGQCIYEPDGGALARAEGYVVMVEGETDTATLLYSGVPALGVPGAASSGALELEHVEGLRMVFVVQETDQAGPKFVAGVTERLQELGVTLPVHALKMPNGAKDPSALYQRDPAKFAELIHGALIEASKPPPEPLDDVWRTLGEWGALNSEPPPRRWLLDRPDEETNGARRIGVLPLGKVGMLVSAGGVGKTMALVELALAVATGRKWFDHFGVQNPGAVLLALGEEDYEEIWRRVFTAARAMRLTDEQLQRAADNIVAMPLAGTSVKLVKTEDGLITDAPMMTALRRRLATREWRLIVIDPLSRFAGIDTENDNASATAFVSVLESLVKVPGTPSLLVAHHTNKTSRTDGSEADAAHTRGVSALGDGVRWVANLSRASDDAVIFKVTKSNYASSGPKLELFRDGDLGGYLRVQSHAEAENRLSQISEKAQARLQTMRELVLKTIAENPGLTTANAIYKIVKGNRPAMFAALKELKVEGWIESSRDGFRLTDRSGLK